MAVRKRVIKIFCELIENKPDLDKKPEILSRILQRINDEDAIKKLCIDTFKSLWFQPVDSKNKKIKLNKKVFLSNFIIKIVLQVFLTRCTVL